MTSSVARRYIANFILESDNPVVRSIKDKNNRSEILSYMYYFMFQNDFLDTCRSIDQSDASADKILKILQAIPPTISSVDSSEPIDMTKIINSFLAVCHGKSAVEIFDAIIRTKLFNVQYKYSKLSNAIIARKNIHDDILRSISIPTHDLVLPQKMVINRGLVAKDNSIAIPKTIVFDVRGSYKIYKLDGMISMEDEKHKFWYFKNNDCLECSDSAIAEFSFETVLTDYTDNWKTLFYHSISTTEGRHAEDGPVIKLGVETDVKHDDAEVIASHNNACKTFYFLKVAPGQKLNLEDVTTCAKPIMSKMNKFFENALKVLRADTFREMDIGALNFEMIKREVTGEQSIVYEKSQNLKEALKKIYESGK